MLLSPSWHVRCESALDHVFGHQSRRRKHVFWITLDTMRVVTRISINYANLGKDGKWEIELGPLRQVIPLAWGILHVWPPEVKLAIWWVREMGYLYSLHSWWISLRYREFILSAIERISCMNCYDVHASIEAQQLPQPQCVTPRG